MERKKRRKVKGLKNTEKKVKTNAREALDVLFQSENCSFDDTNDSKNWNEVWRFVNHVPKCQ